MAKEKIKFIFKDVTDKELFSFYSKTATKEFGLLPQGTSLKVFCDEGKDFGEQFIGDYVVKGFPDGPLPPPDPNKPPVVNAGADITVKQGTVVNMDGSAIDTDGQLDRVEWHQITPLPQVVLNADSSDATNVSFTAPDVPAGQANLVLEFMLEAFDNKGASAVDKIKVTITTDVTPPPPPPPAEGVLWTSKSWANGHARIIKGVATDPDDKQYEMRAGADVQGKKELEIDGKGNAKQTGERYRQYIWNKAGQAGSQGGPE